MLDLGGGGMKTRESEGAVPQERRGVRSITPEILWNFGVIWQVQRIFYKNCV